MVKRYWYERWLAGKMVGVETLEAKSRNQAVGLLSDQFKGVFKFVGSQTEQQRIKENWQQYHNVSGDF